MPLKKCLMCENLVKRSKSKFCSRVCSGKCRTKDKNRIPKAALIQDYKIDKMTWNDLCKKYNVSLATLKKYIEKHELGFNTHFNFINQKVGKLTVKSKSYIKRTRQYWLCECDCGKEYHTTSSTLLRSKVISCEDCIGIHRRETDIIKTTLWNRYISNAKNRNLEFMITKEYAYDLYIQQNKKCALSGLDISFSPSQGTKMRALTTASLDRIDSTKGYTNDNIQWLHKKVNKLKINMQNQEFINWCTIIGKYNSV